jgi:6-phosphogluconolactonase (cycloisomerase 2 family)
MLFFVEPAPVSAAQTVPYRVNFQGRLTNASGNIVANGSYNMQFRLYDTSSGGTLLWSETREAANRVEVTNGLFSIQLGSVTALSPTLFNGAAARHLEVTMATPATATCSTASCASWESPMTPRQALGSSTYALNSDLLDGQDGSFYQDAGNLTGTVHTDRLSGSYGGITATGTLTGLTVSGATTLNNTTLIKNDSLNALSIQNTASQSILSVNSIGGLVTVGVAGTEDTFTKIANPSSLPNGTGTSLAFTPDGQHVVVGHASSLLSIYSRSGSTMTKLTNPASMPPGEPRDLTYSPDSQHLAVGSTGSPYLTLYKRSGDTYTKLADPAVAPTGVVTGTAYSPDGQYLSLGISQAPYIAIYKRSGDTYTKLADPAVTPTGAGWQNSFSPDGVYMSIAHNTSPYVSIYKRSGDTFTKLANPATLPTGDAYATAFSPDGKFMTVAHSVSPFITIYQRTGDTFTKVSNPSSLPTATGQGTVFSPDNKYMAVMTSGTPNLNIYKRSGDTFTKVSDPGVLPAGSGDTVEFSADSQYLGVAHATSPYMTIYRLGTGDVTVNGSLTATGGIQGNSLTINNFAHLQGGANVMGDLSVSGSNGNLLNVRTSETRLYVADVAPMTAAVVGSNVITKVTTYGSYISSALGSDGFARMSYYDSSGQDLKFIQCTDTDCTTKNITTVDSTGVVGFDSDIAIGSDGFARISYYDASNGDLKFAQCTNADCTTRNITTVDSTNNVGSDTSIAIGSDGFARISYSYNTNGDLKFAQCTNADCTTRNITTVDSANSVGQDTSLGIGSDGFARIVYNDNTNSKLRFAQCTNAACSTSNQTVVADSSNSGTAASLALGGDGFARIAYRYYNNPTSEFRYVQCTNAACSTNNNTLLSQNDYVSSVSLVIATDDFARIAYGSNTQSDLRYIQCTNALCSTKTDTAIDTYGSKGNYTTLYLGADGYARITYYGSEPTTVGGDLLFARLTSQSGAEIRAGVNLGSSTTDAFAEIYAKKVDVQGSVTIDATNRSKYGAAVTILGADTYIDARGSTGSYSKFSVTKDTLSYSDTTGNNTFSAGVGGVSAYNNSGATHAFQAYQAGTGNGIVSTVMPTASSALLLYNEDTGNEMLKINAEGKATFVSESVDTKAFSFGAPGGVSLFAIDTSNSRVQVGDATADGTGVVLVLDNKNTAGDPVGTNGAMYYNSSLSEFRCYKAGAWKNCALGQYIPITMLATTHADGQNMFFGTTAAMGTATAGQRKIYFPQAGTIKGAKIWSYATTAGSGEAWTMYIRKGGLDTQIDTVGAAANERSWTNSSLNISVAAGDWLEMRSINPTWATNPDGVVYSGYIYLE